MPWWGADLSEIDFKNIFYFIRSTEKQASNWEDLPDDIRGTWDKLGIPEAEKKYLGGVSAQYESEVVYHKIKKELDDIGVHLHRHGLRAARLPGPGEGVLRHADPVQRQQVRGAEHRRVVGRVVHLRAAGRAGRHPAAGVLPDQRREHGPVRAHADHRRRGQLRALRRGLLRADLLERLAALRRRRDRREEGRAGPLHDDPELVDERLQPRHEARRRLRGRRDGVGRRQHRLEGHDEVPVDLPDRQGRARRGAVGGVRRQGHAHRRRRQGDPRRAVHDERDQLEVGVEGRRPHRLPRPRSAWSPMRTTRSPPCAATR